MGLNLTNLPAHIQIFNLDATPPHSMGNYFINCNILQMLQWEIPAPVHFIKGYGVYVYRDNCLLL